MAVQITGLKEFQRALAKREAEHESAVKQIVRQDGMRLQRYMNRTAQFRKGYSQGDTQSSIKLMIADGGFTAMVGPQTSYSPYLEYGTRYMSAQPFVTPAFNVIKPIFLADLERLAK